jgi:hypothetical protein
LTDLDISPIVRSQNVRLNVDLVTFDITGGDGVPRTANITRKTKETKINMKLALDGSGECRIKTSVGFLDHMLTLLAAHGRFDLELQAEGDLWVDQHHTVEDIGICLGQAFAKALGKREKGRGVRDPAHSRVLSGFHPARWSHLAYQCLLWGQQPPYNRGRFQVVGSSPEIRV